MKSIYFFFVYSFLSLSVCAQEAVKFIYTPNERVAKFAINESVTEIAYWTGDDLVITGNGELIKFTSINYRQDGLNMSFTSSMSNIEHLIYSENDLWVSTSDGHLLRFRNREFVGAFPMNVHSCYLNDNHEIMVNSSIPLVPSWGALVLEDINMTFDDFTFDALLPTDEITTSPTRQYPLINMTDDGVFSSVADDGTTILNYLNGDFKINSFDPTRLPFTSIESMAMVHNTNIREFHLWSLTDDGMYYYPADPGAFTFENWEEDNWVAFDPDRNLIPKNLDGISNDFTRSNNTHIVYAWTNNPRPEIFILQDRFDISVLQ